MTQICSNSMGVIKRVFKNGNAWLRSKTEMSYSTLLYTPVSGVKYNSRKCILCCYLVYTTLWISNGSINSQWNLVLKEGEKYYLNAIAIYVPYIKYFTLSSYHKYNQLWFTDKEVMIHRFLKVWSNSYE